MNTQTQQLFTRKDYLSSKCQHEAYYGQFVTKEVRDMVKGAFGIERLKDAFAADKYLNNIPMKKWDKLSELIPRRVCLHICKANQTNGLSLSDRVCTLKEAARQIINGAK